MYSALRFARLVIFLGVSLSGIATRQTFADEKAKSDHERLQGAWKVVRVEFGGEVLRDEVLDHLVQLVFVKKQIEYQTETYLWEGSFKLNIMAEPKELRVAFDGYEMTMVYGFDGENLIVAHPNGRRQLTKLSSGTEKAPNHLYTLERTTLVKEDPAADFGPAKIAAMRRARLRCGAKLLRLLIAMHHYYDDHDSFPPPAITDAGGVPLLSWRVAMLPYLGEKELYAQFRRGEPWDSPHNKKLLPKMPKAYATIGRDPKWPHGTFFQVLVGDGCLFESGKPIVSADIKDGTVGTIAIVTAAEDVPWTKPADLEYSADKPLPNFIGGMLDDGLISFVSGAGNVHISVNIFDKEKEPIFRAGITRSGAERESRLENLRP